MDRNTRIIRALEQKTVANGASPEEELSAKKKIKELKRKDFPSSRLSEYLNKNLEYHKKVKENSDKMAREQVISDHLRWVANRSKIRRIINEKEEEQDNLLWITMIMLIVSVILITVGALESITSMLSIGVILFTCQIFTIRSYNKLDDEVHNLKREYEKY